MRYRHFLQKKYSYGQEAPFLREAGKKDASEALTEAAFREMLLHGPLSSEGLRPRMWTGRSMSPKRTSMKKASR